jgi:hypothetical protein
MAILAPSPRMVARASFTCPVTHRVVSASFLASPASPEPVDVTACSLFDGAVRCQKGCLAHARTGWAPSAMTPRYALLADGAAAR